VLPTTRVSTPIDAFLYDTARIPRWDGFPGDFAEGLCGTSQKDIELLRFRDALDAGKKRWDWLRNPKHDTVGKVMPRPKPMS
jgi:hypothetical protein